MGLTWTLSTQTFQEAFSPRNMGARLESWTSLPGTRCCWPRRRTLWESSANLSLPLTASWARPRCPKGWPQTRSVMTPWGLWNHSCTPVISQSPVSATFFKSFPFFFGEAQAELEVLLLVLNCSREEKPAQFWGWAMGWTLGYLY